MEHSVSPQYSHIEVLNNIRLVDWQSNSFNQIQKPETELYYKSLDCYFMSFNYAINIYREI